MGETLDRMLPSFVADVGETTIALLKLAERTEVERSRWQTRWRDEEVGLVLTLKERNLSKRTRLPESAWGFPEECTSLGANESNLADSIVSVTAAAASGQRKWIKRPASSSTLGHGAKLSEIG
jgi:hypothetical protein